MSITQREFETLQAILHHVGCYNGRRIEGVSAERLTLTAARMPGTEVSPVVPGDLVIDGVQFAPTRGKSA